MTRSGNDDRRRIGRSGRLLATTVVLALAVAAVGVRAAAGATLRNAGLATAAAIGLALLFAIAALITATKYREHVRTTDAASTVEDRLRQATVAVLFASAVLVPFALLLLRRPGTGNETPDQDTPSVSPSLAPTGRMSGRHAPPKGTGHLFDLREFMLVVTIIIGVILLAWLVAMAIRLLRNVPAVSPAASTAPIAQSMEEDEALADALLAGRSELSGKDTRAAIIACYAAMEASLGQAGVTREHSDSPSDLLRRAMTRDLPSAGTQGAATLTSLFREARFSTHPMTAQQLESARSALDAVTAALSERIHAQAQVVTSP